jgi:hypothetical protein
MGGDSLDTLGMPGVLSTANIVRWGVENTVITLVTENASFSSDEAHEQFYRPSRLIQPQSR